MLTSTDTKYDLFSFSDAIASEFRFTDVVLLSSIRFIDASDFAEVADSVSVVVGQTSVEYIAIEDLVYFVLDVPADDSIDTPDEAIVSLSTPVTDSSDTEDSLLLELWSNNAETLLIVDSLWSEVTVSVDDFVSVNEEVQFGQQSFFTVNNIVVPEDSISQDYSDKNTNDSAGVSDTVDIGLRQRQSSLLGASNLGNITLGVRHD